MLYVFTSYVYTKGFDNPAAWLARIDAYAGILEALATENEVICINQIDFEGNCAHNGVNHHFKRYSKQALRFFPLKLNLYIKSLKPDVVVVQGLHCPLQVMQLRLLMGNKVKIMVQHRAEKPFTGYKKTLQQLADRCINAYLFGSKPLGLEWVKSDNLGSAKKIYEVMGLSSVFYPVENAIARQKTGVDGDPAFLWAGRLNANKDPLTVVKAFLKFTETAPFAKLYMIYQTYELLPDIKNLLAAHPNQQNVVLIGKVPHNELLFWFNSVSFLISGSHYEGGGTVVCEAMSCGCIPVITNIPSFCMITNNGECGILYEAGNENALLKALNKTQHSDLEMLKKQALDHFNANLSFKAIAMQIQEIAAL